MDNTTTNQPHYKRLTWYLKYIDPEVLENMSYEARDDVRAYDLHDQVLEKPTEEHPANLVSSLCDDGYHRPALDLDFDLGDPQKKTEVVAQLASIFRWFSADIELVPSTHFWHAYIPKPFTHEEYEQKLQECYDHGLIQPGFLNGFRKRKQTVLRPPGTKKFNPYELVGDSVYGTVENGQVLLTNDSEFLYQDEESTGFITITEDEALAVAYFILEQKQLPDDIDKCHFVQTLIRGPLYH